MFTKLHSNILFIYSNKLTSICSVKQKGSKFPFSQNLRQLSTPNKNETYLEKQIKDVFKFKNTNVSNWIIEVSV